jgi:hypothetical protein
MTTVNVVLLVDVLGVLAIAIVVDLAVIIEWLKGRWR